MLTAAQLAEHAPEDARIALAGRSRAKLETARAEVGGRALDWPLVVVDATDVAGPAALAARTTVLASTVGPYAAYGKEVVRACAEEGTHYADLTGEVLFVRWSLDEVDARARRDGCGHRPRVRLRLDPVRPRCARHRPAGALPTTRASSVRRPLLVRSLKGGFSGGTIDSSRQQAITARTDAVRPPHDL